MGRQGSARWAVALRVGAITGVAKAHGADRAIGLTLAVGVLGGVVIERATSTPSTAVTTTGQPLAVTVTQAGHPPGRARHGDLQPQPTGNSNGPKANGNYPVGAELTPGTWQCGEASDLIYSAERDRGGDLIEKG